MRALIGEHLFLAKPLILKDAPKITMLVFPRIVALDLINPMTMFKIARTNIMLVGKGKQPVDTDVREPIAATQSFADIPDDIDVLFVPGGPWGRSLRWGTRKLWNSCGVWGPFASCAASRPGEPGSWAIPAAC